MMPWIQGICRLWKKTSKINDNIVDTPSAYDYHLYINKLSLEAAMLKKIYVDGAKLEVYVVDEKEAKSLCGSPLFCGEGVHSQLGKVFWGGSDQAGAIGVPRDGETLEEWLADWRDGWVFEFEEAGFISSNVNN